MNYLTLFLQQLVAVFLTSAPWLILGFLIAGLVKALIPTAFLNRHLGQDNTTAVFKGALLGAPLPLCSCGVIPAALGLRRAGASKASTTAFLIATPETGVDSVSLSYALLGPVMAIVRPFSAITTAIVAGLAVLWFGDSKATNVDTQPAPAKYCCGSKQQPLQIDNSVYNKILAGLRFIFIDLITDTSLWLSIGLIVAAIILAFVPAAWLATWGNSPYAYVAMALVGMPMYICATASTPIAASLLFAGVSPGAVLVFLLVGPATNIATLAIVHNELGKRILSIYLISILGVSFLFAWLTDTVVNHFTVSVLVSNAHSHATYDALTIVSGIVLAALLINGLYRHFAKTTS